MTEHKPHSATHIRIYSPTGMTAAYDCDIDADELARRVFDLIAELREDAEPRIGSDGWYSTTYSMGANKQPDAVME